jgi:redox-sensing transcriptional repressor
MSVKNIPTQTLRRLPLYLNYLKSLPQGASVNISATAIAEALGLNNVQVRKDLAFVSDGGKPKIGYVTENLILDLERFLGYDDAESAVIVGVGNLGHALLSYKGFKAYGLHIVAGFDTNQTLIGMEIDGKPIMPVERLGDLCRRMKIHIGIITVPEQEAQTVCDSLVESGVRAIWNFAPVHLKAPENVLIQNENMAASLAVLSKHLTERFFK